MKKISLILLFVGLQVLHSAINDTLNVKLNEVSVNADRIVSDNFVKYNFHSVINEAEISRFQPWQLSDVINNYSGIFIRDYGGLGGLKTVSLRSMNTSQNIVLLNGVRVNSSQNMVADLSLLSDNLFNKIEIIKGGNSAIFGSGSMGGVINLINKISENKVAASLNLGSFNEKQIKFGYSDTSYLFKSSGNFNYESSSGNYDFEIDGKNFQRKNSDFSKISISENFQTSFSNTNLNIMLNFLKSERGIPGPVIYNHDIEYTDARLKEIVGMGIFKMDKYIENNYLITLSANTNIHKTNYFDKNFLGVNGEFQSEYLNSDIGSSVKLKFTDSDLIYNLKIEYNYSQLESDNGIVEKTKYYRRNNIALSADIESEIMDIKPLKLNYLTGIRFDYFSDVASSPSGFLGLILHLNSLPMNIKGNISYNFRPPSFNELYYFNFGNINLNPEKSISYNIGCNYISDNFQVEINGFYNFIDDQIISVPQNPVYWTAQNIQKVNVKGFEINLDGSFFNNFNYKLNFSYSKAIDKSPNSLNFNQNLVYSPEIMSNLMIFYNISDFETGFTFNYTGKSYYLPDNQEEFTIPDYLIVNYFANYSWYISQYEINFTLNIRNLTDKNYFIIKSYPMPGINIRGGLNVKI